MRQVHSTSLGKVYQADCIELLGALKAGSIHTLFADPPFNLNKDYGTNGGDDLPAAKYLEWSKQWITESVRVLAPGGSLFIYNLPKWLIEYGSYLNTFSGMTFKTLDRDRKGPQLADSQSFVPQPLRDALLHQRQEAPYI